MIGMNTNLGHILLRRKARISVDYIFERLPIPFPNPFGDVPFAPVRDDAVRCLWRRRKAELGLSFENNHGN